MPLNFQKARNYLNLFDFHALFIEELGWNQPSSQTGEPLDIEDQTYTRTRIAEMAGVPVFEVAAADGEIPTGEFRGKIHRAIALLAPPASAQQICETDGNYEPASEIYRTVELTEFSISLTIPENYRLMRRQNGSVEILHPDDYEWLQCLANGGVGAHGYYSETISQVAPDPSMSLQEQTAWSMGYTTNADGSRTPGATQVFPYQINGLEGYIATSMSGYSVTFLGTVPGSDHLLQVTAGCDCEVFIEDVANLLQNIRPLEEE